MNGPVLALLQLQPGETAAVPQLHDFAAAHPGVRIITPHYQDEPWRADIAAGTVPGDRGSARIVGAKWPTELLGKLQCLFGDTG